MEWQAPTPSQAATTTAASEPWLAGQASPEEPENAAYSVDPRYGPQSTTYGGDGMGNYWSGTAANFGPGSAPAYGCASCLPVAYAQLAAMAGQQRGAYAPPLVVWDDAQYAWGPSARGMGRPGGAGPTGLPPSALAFNGDGAALPAEFEQVVGAPRATGPIVIGPGGPERAMPAKRWSADAWALMRRNSPPSLPPGALPATYGASQAGAVLRFRIDRRSGYRPTAYLRTTSTLGALPESTAALGVSARPFPKIPVFAAVEGRLTQSGGRNRIAPAGMIVTEFPPLDLPMDMRAEIYGQAGYVGGQFATPFADGQLRLDHGLFSLGPVDARLGAGAWGGIQKGASRLDVGPGMTFAFPLARRTYGRIAIDWRKRVSGHALPGDGATLTLSAGF